MKKLMIAAAIVCAAAISQAASYTWSSSSPVYTWDSADPDWPVMAGQTAYFVFADAYSQAALVADFAGTGADFTKLSAAGNGVVAADGTIGDTAASSSYTEAKQAYFVVFDAAKETMFISGTVTAAYDALDSSAVTFDYDQVEGVWEATVGVTSTRFDAASGYVGAGYYSAASAVPEPTSGLLMLLGVAGLALRRRRA